MPTSYFYQFASILFLLIFCTNACKGQLEKKAAEESALPSKPSPIIVGTPPPWNGNQNPYNDPTLVSQYIRSIFQDSKGNYWFGPAGQSVARYEGDTLRYFSKLEFFRGNDKVETDRGNSVHAITEDTAGNIWFGTHYGAVKYDGKSFRSYQEKEGLTNLKLGRKCILVDNAGKLWVGTQGGVFRYMPSADSTGGKCFSLFQLIPKIEIKDMMEDKEGNIWFATKDQGIFRYDGKTVKNFSLKARLGDNYAGGMAEDKQGNLWFTMKGGICRFDGTSFTDINLEEKIGTDEIWGIYIERSGIIWITARGSTTRFDPSLPPSDSKAFQVFTPSDGLNCCVQSMYQDRAGNMWWGAGDGLHRFNGENFYQVKQKGPW
ncbi:MAG: two-component regulator propeller domain-containing protein [Bacteroidota bacterium]